jgi:hypothetical protein
MKKTTYTLLALLLICIVAIGVLWAGRVSDRKQIAEMEVLLQDNAAELDNTTVKLNALQKEKNIWDQEKARVGQSLGSVRGVLIKTLGDLEEVSASIGVPLAVATPAASVVPEQTTKAPAVTAEPTVTVQATKAPVTSTGTPASSPTAAVSPTTSKATEKPAVSPTPGATAQVTATTNPPEADATATPFK